MGSTRSIPGHAPPSFEAQPHADDPQGTRSLLLIGGASLLALAIPMAWVGLQGGALLDDAGRSVAAAWWACFGLFTLVWLVLAFTGAGGAVRVSLLVVQSLAALLANWLVPTVFSGVAIGGLLLMMVAAQLAVLPSYVAFIWIAAQSIALLAIYFDAHWPAHVSISAAGAYAAGQLAMLGIGRMAQRQKVLRVALAETVAELISARAMLAESARSAERVRIARELHDVLGHHLVALRLQLEAAALDAEQVPAARERIVEAANLARLLLADVRAAVSDLREGASVDLVAALRTLATGAPGPRIEVMAAPDFDAGEPARAATLLRCAQEAVTNARRHAGATRIEITLEGETLRIRDDGRGIGNALPGSGLRGMQERAAELGGSVSLATPPGGGTEVRVWIPRVLAPATALHRTPHEIPHEIPHATEAAR